MADLGSRASSDMAAAKFGFLLLTSAGRLTTILVTLGSKRSSDGFTQEWLSFWNVNVGCADKVAVPHLLERQD